MNTDHALRLEAGVTRQVAFRLISRGCGNSASYDKRGFRTQVIEAKHETCEASASYDRPRLEAVTIMFPVISGALGFTIFRGGRRG